MSSAQNASAIQPLHIVRFLPVAVRERSPSRVPLGIRRTIQAYLYENLNDQSIRVAIGLWFGKKKTATFRFGCITATGTCPRSLI